jgi:hypothetical protein
MGLPSAADLGIAISRDIQIPVQRLTADTGETGDFRNGQVDRIVSGFVACPMPRVLSAVAYIAIKVGYSL